MNPINQGHVRQKTLGGSRKMVKQSQNSPLN